MAKAEASETINRPVEEVFAYVTEIENTPQWSTGWVEVKQTSPGPMAEGATFRTVGKFLGQRIEQTYELTEFEPQRRFAARSTSGPIPTRWEYTFEPSGGGTRVNATAEFDPSGLFKLAEPIVANMAKRQLATDLANLKDILEAQGR